MSFSSTFTSNSNITTITINIQCDINTQMEWKINSDGTNGSVKVTDLDNLPEPVVPIKTAEPVVPIKTAEPVVPIKTAEPVKTPEPATTPATYPEDEKVKHVTVIKAMLNRQDEIKGKENKAENAIKILDYVSGEALDFTKAYERFKNTVINKCYEFKQENADMPEVVKKADETLIKLGASTTIPADWKKPEKCRVCGDIHPTPVVSKIVNEVINAWADSQPPIVAPKPVTTATKPAMENTYALDLALFTALAKKYNFKNAMEHPKLYLSYFDNDVRWNSNTVEGNTKAEKMTSYFTHCTDDGQRIALMKTIFEKHTLIFNDAAMTLYSDWQKTYKPTGKTNRYIKMNEFATIHKVLFTA